MSRLIDELNRAAREAAQPMGFRTARTAPAGPRLRLIASLAETEGVGRANLLEGADAALLHLTKADAAKALSKIAGTLPDIPWGVWLDDIGAKKWEALIEAGADFVVFPLSRQVTAAPLDEKTGKVLQIELSLGDGLLRAINDLPVGAVLAADAAEVGGATWHQLMHLQRLGNILVKPILAPVPSNVTAEELRALWEAGVDGVVVGAGTAGRLLELRQAIDKFPPHLRKRGKTEAILPHISSALEAAPEEEEEDE
jgi:hypothetical protein